MTESPNILKRVTITIEPYNESVEILQWTLECCEVDVAFLSDKPVRSLLDDSLLLSPRDHAEFTFKWFRNLRGEKMT